MHEGSESQSEDGSYPICDGYASPLPTGNPTSTGSASGTPSIAEKGAASTVAGNVIGSVIVLLLIVGFALVMAVCIRRRGKTMKGKQIPTVFVGEGEAFGDLKYNGVTDDNSE